MSNSLEVVISYLEKIKQVPGRNAKFDLLKSLVKEDIDETFKKMLQYTYHPYWNYWLKWDPSQYENYKQQPVKTVHWEAFAEILDELKERKITGNKAKEKVDQWLKMYCSKREKYWFSQILNRRLEVGLLMRSYNKFYPDLLPEVKFMLCEDWKKNDLRGDWYIEPKIDGERAAVIFDPKGNATVISRNGHPKTNCEHIVDDLRPLAEEVGYGVVFDGELAGESWGDVGASRGKKKSKKLLKYWLFDWIPFKNWNEHKYNKIPNAFLREEHSPQLDAFLADRRLSLEWRFDSLEEEPEFVEMVPEFFYKDPSSKTLTDLKDKMLKDGYEGWVAKRCRSYYLFKRDVDWLKAKFRETVDLKVIDATEGKGKYKGVGIGALICEGTIGKGKKAVKVHTEVGQGFSDKYRKKFYQMWKVGSLKGLVVELDHYGVTDALRTNKTSKKLPALRNAIFKRPRKDKTER